MKNVEFQITGMHCASCAAIINRAMDKTAGISKANVNYSTARAKVVYDPKQVKEADLIGIVKKKGFGAMVYDAKKSNQAALQKEEIADFKFRFFTSLVFAIPAFIIGMVFMWIGYNMPYHAYVLWALATPVQFYIGWPFYVGTWNALKNKTANMDSLIAIGTSAAYFFSFYAIVFAPELGQYFETSALLITLVLFGKYLEARAKGKTSDAIKKLMSLSAKEARVISSFHYHFGRSSLVLN